MYKQESWNLKDLIKDSNKIEQIIKSLENKTKKLEEKRKLLKPEISGKDFLQILKDFEDLDLIEANLSSYGGLWFTENTLNQKAAALKTKINILTTHISNKLIFFYLWFKDLDEKNAKRLIKTAKDHTYYLKKIRKAKKYILSEKEEKIISIKDTTGINALIKIYDTFTSSFRYKFNNKILTTSELLTHTKSYDPKKRKEAYQTLLSKYREHKNVLGELYKNVVNDWREENINIRGHKSPISVRNYVNDIPDKSIQSLIKTCKKNHYLFQQFFKIKAKRLGIKKLKRYDIYAPIIKKERKINYNEAVNLCLDAYKSFSPEFYKGVKQIIDKKHINSKQIPGKIGGAFCSSNSPKNIPYILINYEKTERDVSTLAHELGHGIHAVLANKNNILNYDVALPLAETASTFGELLLAEKIKKDKPELAQKLIFHKLEDVYATIIRQIGFTEFEITAHEMIKNHKTTDDLSSIYIKQLKEQLGNSVTIPEEFKNEWNYIPHIYHTPFYCYAYSFGNLLSLALYEKYLEEGKRFIPKLHKFLATAGTKNPSDTAKITGIDINSEKLWQSGFILIKKMLKEIN